MPKGLFSTTVVSLGLSIALGAQNKPAAPSDVYHVLFNKAAPGQAIALGDDLKKPDSTSSMPTHKVILRHQEGDDWDYCVIEHAGTTATVKITPPTPPAPNAPPLSAWHSDTFVAGPSWAEFSQAMGLANPAQTVNSVYVVGTLRAVPGHRMQLNELLRRPEPSKVSIGHVVMEHLEGGPWQFFTIDRYNSWQDFATDRAANAAATGTGKDGWSENRQHVAFHVDTLADRLLPR